MGGTTPDLRRSGPPNLIHSAVSRYPRVSRVTDELFRTPGSTLVAEVQYMYRISTQARYPI
jgi:hypothetical protein